MNRKKVCIIIAIFFFLVALGITLYPIISTWYNARHQSQLHSQYQEQMQHVDTDRLQKEREKAIAYNQSITPGSQQVDHFTQESLNNASEDYKNLLNLSGNGIMGYVQVPSVGITLPIFHGTNDATLERGVGHLLGSSLPVGGVNTHTILTAHSGMASMKMFSDLDLLEKGDVFYLEVLGEKLAYRVDQIKVVLPHDTTYLGITSGKDYCTLVTCTPFGVNTHRLLVRGSRIPYGEAEEEIQQIEDAPQQASTWERQYLKGLLIGLGSVAALVLIILHVHWIRRWRNVCRQSVYCHCADCVVSGGTGDSAVSHDKRMCCRQQNGKDG